MRDLVLGALGVLLIAGGVGCLVAMIYVWEDNHDEEEE